MTIKLNSYIIIYNYIINYAVIKLYYYKYQHPHIIFAVTITMQSLSQSAIINMYIINMPIMLMYPYDLILRYYIIIYIHIGSITNLL